MECSAMTMLRAKEKEAGNKFSRVYGRSYGHMPRSTGTFLVHDPPAEKARPSLCSARRWLEARVCLSSQNPQTLPQDPTCEVLEVQMP